MHLCSQENGPIVPDMSRYLLSTEQPPDQARAVALAVEFRDRLGKLWLRDRSGQVAVLSVEAAAPTVRARRTCMDNLPPTSGQARRLHPIGVPIDATERADRGATRVLQESPAASRRFASLASTLPVPATPLVGRAADLASLVELTREHRVVTITGPGGVGKTRLVIELGRQLAPAFLDDVAFIALADITDAAAFVPALANALDVKEAGRADAQ